MERASALWTHSAKRNPSRNRSCAIASAVAGRSGGSTPWMKNYSERRFDRVALFGCGGRGPSCLALWHWTECTAGGGNTALIRSGWLVGSPAKTTTGCTDLLPPQIALCIEIVAAHRKMHRGRTEPPSPKARDFAPRTRCSELFLPGAAGYLRNDTSGPARWRWQARAATYQSEVYRGSRQRRRSAAQTLLSQRQ